MQLDLLYALILKNDRFDSVAFLKQWFECWKFWPFQNIAGLLISSIPETNEIYICQMISSPSNRKSYNLIFFLPACGQPHLFQRPFVRLVGIEARVFRDITAVSFRKHCILG
ncbi:hypothetical protein ABW19_dt0207968 [Dactylella cylindrospora]|nr:hypothetical protein ABW19_dt0207968 [Dactylella cylindrospora]